MKAHNVLVIATNRVTNQTVFVKSFDIETERPQHIACLDEIQADPDLYWETGIIDGYVVKSLLEDEYPY